MKQPSPKLIVVVTVIATLALVLLMGCERQGVEREVVYFDDVTPTPPPFQTQTLRIGAGEQRSVSYSIESAELSEGQWCLDYYVDLIQEGSRNDLDLDSFITIPTGEAVRQVTINALNSPIQGKLYADHAGQYAIVLDNRPSLFTSKTVSLKTRMYYPC